MADQFENQLPQKNDAKWVRALDASGNPILISKEDLASVVGELIGTASPEKDGLMSTISFMNRGKATIQINCNDLKLSGLYPVYCYGENISSKNYPFELGHIIVFNDKVGGSITQLGVSSSGAVLVRHSWGGVNWSQWRQL